MSTMAGRSASVASRMRISTARPSASRRLLFPGFDPAVDVTRPNGGRFSTFLPPDLLSIELNGYRLAGHLHERVLPLGFSLHDVRLQHQQHFGIRAVGERKDRAIKEILLRV